MDQLQLFDPSKCISFGEEMHKFLWKEFVPGSRQKHEGERLQVGACSRALAIVGDNRDHPDFRHFCAAIQKMGEPVDQHVGLINAYRFATNPKTAALVSHLPGLTQVQGYINQLSINGKSGKEGDFLPPTPNQAQGPINFDDISKGGSLLPHVSGQIGEDSVKAILDRLEINHTTQFPSTFIGWGKKEAARPDFKVAPFNVEPLEQGFYIEVKWRNRPGSVDDNLVALLHNIESWYDLPTLIIYDGVGATKRTYEMVCHQMEQKRRKLPMKLLAFMTFSEFVLFAQTQLGKQRREVAA